MPRESVAEVIVPAGGMAGTEALLLSWSKQIGDGVAAGEVIAEVETDKATMEIEAPAGGVIAHLHFEAGQIVPLGVPIAEISVGGESGRAAPPAETPPAETPPADEGALQDGAAAASATQQAIAPPPARARRRKQRRRDEPDGLTRLRDPSSIGVRELDLDGTPSDRLLEWLDAMLVIREFEEACEPVARAGKIPGGMHSSAGQEAVAVGATRALEQHDIVVSSHRSHHTSLAKGISPRSVMAELYGKAVGCVGGRGGHMHLADFSIGLWGSNGIVGGGLGLGVGIALAAQVRALDQVCLAYFGDGGANTGRVWESINLASLWTLPLVVVCENNLWAVETFVGDATAATSIADRAKGFGLPAVQIDGQDVCAMYRAVREARTRAAAGDGPTFIEAVTFRYRGHNTGDPQRYRTKDEVDSWQEARDPIARLQRALERHALATQESYEAALARARAAASDAVAYAEAAAWPDPASAARAVFSAELER